MLHIVALLFLMLCFALPYSSTHFKLYLQLMVSYLWQCSTMLRMALIGLVGQLLDTTLVMVTDTSRFQDHGVITYSTLLMQLEILAD